MLTRFNGGKVAFWALQALAVALSTTSFAGDKAPPRSSSSRLAIERGLAFLERDAAAWKKERQCATCHHGSMTLWAALEAKRGGAAVDSARLAELQLWTRASFIERIKAPRDTRPGYNLVNYQALLYGVMDRAVPGSGAEADLATIRDHMVRHQETEGCWDSPSGGRPPVFESASAITGFANLALLGSSLPAAERGTDWLADREGISSTQVAALRLMALAWSGASASAVEEASAELRTLQQKDGGWAQAPGLSSDAYATGQALYALRVSGITRDNRAVARGTAFLVATQKEDGSWPMASRPAMEGGKPAGLLSPIVHFGSAWATMGLARASGK